jgi:DNA-binding NarL/FixJ family response regulator
MSVRILIADDHGIVRQGLRMYLQFDPELEIVGEASNGKEALDLAGNLKPDIVLIRAAFAGQVQLSRQVALRMVAEHEESQLLESLTERETEVLRLVAQGHSNKEIAQSLVISEKTVKSHVGNILSKLGAASRTQAALIAVRSGITKLAEK